MKTLILIYIIKNTGYMLIIFTGAITSLEKEYKEAFLLDSNSNLIYAAKIVVPLIAPIIFFVVILSIINSFSMFREVYALYGNTPPNTAYLLQNFMNNNFYKLNYQRLSTAAFIVVVGISLLIIGFLKFQDKYLNH
ncbi:ABC transporter permease subunit [Tissierella carlieri]